MNVPNVNFNYTCFQALDKEFEAQLDEQERQAASSRIPSSSALAHHNSTLHSSRTSLASSHYD